PAECVTQCGPRNLGPFGARSSRPPPLAGHCRGGGGTLSTPAPPTPPQVRRRSGGAATAPTPRLLGGGGRPAAGSWANHLKGRGRIFGQWGSATEMRLRCIY